MKFLRVEKGKIDWTVPELQLIDEFRFVYDRDKSADKEQANSDFIFIFFSTDYRSPYIGYELLERTTKAKREARLPDTWEPDSVVIAAAEKYAQLQDGVSVQLLIGVKSGLQTAVRVVNFINGKLNKIIEALDTYDETSLTDPQTLATYNTLVDSLNTNSDKILAKAGKLRDQLENLAEVEQMVQKEQTESAKISGGKKKMKRMD
jgi:hypothetical protein